MPVTGDILRKIDFDDKSLEDTSRADVIFELSKKFMEIIYGLKACEWVEY